MVWHYIIYANLALSPPSDYLTIVCFVLPCITRAAQFLQRTSETASGLWLCSGTLTQSLRAQLCPALFQTGLCHLHPGLLFKCVLPACVNFLHEL